MKNFHEGQQVFYYSFQHHATNSAPVPVEIIRYRGIMSNERTWEVSTNGYTAPALIFERALFATEAELAEHVLQQFNAPPEIL